MAKNNKIITSPFIFTPACIGRAGEDIALQIESAILNEQIGIGESLPSERELQIQFQTGRGVVREAIRALKQKGLIEIRKGAKGGAYVKQIDVANVGESLALFLKQQQVGPAHIAEFRESIDRTITTLAIARGSAVEKQQLMDKADTLLTCLGPPEPDLEALGEIDRELNVCMARMTKNPIFEWIMRALQHGFSSHDYSLYETQDYREKTVTNWRETARQVAVNEPLKALGSVGMHYIMLQRCVAEKQNTLDQAKDSENSSYDESASK